MRYKSMKRHEGSLSSYYQVKETHQKKITYCVINLKKFWNRHSFGDSKRLIVAMLCV